MNYEDFETGQANKWQEPPTNPSLGNYERWTVTRYYNNSKRYFITAREEFGTQFKLYSDIGYWRGGSELENRAWEELRYEYRNLNAGKVSRTRVTANMSVFEVTEYSKPLLLLAVIDHHKILCSDAKNIKEGARYNLK